MVIISHSVESNIEPLPHQITRFPRQENTFLVMGEPMKVFLADIFSSNLKLIFYVFFS